MSGIGGLTRNAASFTTWWIYAGFGLAGMPVIVLNMMRAVGTCYPLSLFLLLCGCVGPSYLVYQYQVPNCTADKFSLPDEAVTANVAIGRPLHHVKPCKNLTSYTFRGQNHRDIIKGIPEVYPVFAGIAEKHGCELVVAFRVNVMECNSSAAVDKCKDLTHSLADIFVEALLKDTGKHVVLPAAEFSVLKQGDAYYKWCRND